MGRKFWKQDRQKTELTKRGIMGELQNEYRRCDKNNQKAQRTAKEKWEILQRTREKNSHCYNFPGSLPLSFLV